MDSINFLIDQMGNFARKLNQFTFAGVPIFTLLACFIVVSIVISVFWRGGRG